MQNDLSNGLDQKFMPWLQLVVLTAYTIVGLFGFMLISYALILPFFHFDIEAWQEALTYPTESENGRLPLLISQGITSIGAFFITPLIFMRKFLKYSLSDFFSTPYPIFHPLVMTIFITFSFMLINSIVVEWNQDLKLPEFLSWF